MNVTNNTMIFPIIRQDRIVRALTSLEEFTASNPKTIVINQTQYNPLFDRVLRDTADVVITPSVNWGFAQAANVGTRLATTEYVTICNDDVEFFWNGWWSGIEKTFAKFETCVATNPMSPKEPGWGYGEEGYRVHATLDECRSDPAAVMDRMVSKWNDSVIDAFAAWCVTFKREPWVELGLFDERFWPGGSEDYDAMCRMYQAGYRALSTAHSWVWHHWGQSKDDKDGFKVALPAAREPWNKLSTKGFGEDGLWHPDCDVWGKNCERTDQNVVRMPL